MPTRRTFRLAFATSAIEPEIHPDDAHLAACLRRLDVEPVACVWNDPGVDWAGFDAVLFRTTWDYFKHYAEFLRWLDRLPVPTINGKALVRWNSDKRYLLDLAGQGVDIIPTELAAAAELPARMRTMAGQEVVVKPTVSGTAWHTARGTAGEPAFNEALMALPPAFSYLVQPFIPEVVDDGEWSLLFFGGEYSHAVIKRPADGDYRVQGEFGGTAQRIEPPGHVVASAERALAVAAALGHADVAYARVDGVVSGGRFLLMELEMIEPFLHLGECPSAAERFAAHLHARLGRLASVAPGRNGRWRTAMLRDAMVATRLPAQNLERARSFYSRVLGLEPIEERPGGLRYQCGSGQFVLFQSSGSASGTHTQMGWEVDDIEVTVATLRARGVVFEEYDMPGLRTINGIAEITGNYPSRGGAGEKGAWFRDSEGNLLGIGQSIG